MPRLLRRWGLWLVIAAAVVVALVIGANRPGHPTLEQQTMSLANQVRCPVCAGESAAQSQVPAAVAIRNQIHQELAAGTPSRQVINDVVRVYGTSILEKPQARGIGLVVWLLPVVVVMIAVLGLILAFARWRRPAPSGPRPDVPLVRPEDEALVARALAAGADEGDAQ